MPEPVAPDFGALTPSSVLSLQHGAGNAVVARLLNIAGEDVSADRITRQSRYKRRLNGVISREARAAGLTPDAVRRELVLMTRSDGVPEFPTPTAAVRGAVGRLAAERVRRALADLTGDELSQSVILKRLEAAFGGRQQLHHISKNPGFVEALLEAIRTKQSSTWEKATRIQEVGSADWTNDEMQYWNARHYTNKFRVVLGEELEDGTLKIADVLPPPFTELLSSITLATMDRAEATPVERYKPGDILTLTFSSGAATSGHTTGTDWKNIGNVGDTFFGLFYKDEPATNVVPAFIRDAVYYAVWSAEEFGRGWASADWLATAKDSQTEDAKTPAGSARQGELTDIIADIFPDAATRDFTATGGKETEESQTKRRAAFAAMENFEVKKHGPMAVKAWLPVEDNVNQIKKWWVDAKTGALVKLKTKFEGGEVTAASTLLKAARELSLVTHEMQGKEDAYTFDSRVFNGEPDLERDTDLFEKLTRAVEAERARREKETDAMPQAANVPPPPASGPPPPGVRTPH